MHSSFIFLTQILGLLFFSFYSAHSLAQQKILILGDSLSDAYNIKIQSSWPALLQKKFIAEKSDHLIINASISGETTFGAKNRIDKLLAQHQPHIIIIELGGNDGLRGLNFNHSFNNLAYIIQAAKHQQVKVLLVGVRLPPNLGKRYNQLFQQMYSNLQTQEQVNYLPTFLKGIAENAALMQQDGIHPTAEAQPLLQQKVWQALQPLL